MTQVVEPLRITVDPVLRSLTVNDVTVPVSAKLLAFYMFIAFAEQRSITVNQQFIMDIKHAIRYLEYIWYLRGDVRLYQTFGLEDEGDVKYRRYSGMRPLRAKFIQETRAQIHAIFRRTLPRKTVDIIKIHSDGVKGSCTYHIDAALEIVVVEHPFAEWITPILCN